MYIASIIDHYEVFSIKKLVLIQNLYVLLSVITISCGVLASELNCAIRWALFGIITSILIRILHSPNQTHSHTTKPHYGFVLAWLQSLDNNNKKQQQRLQLSIGTYFMCYNLTQII